MKLIAESRFIHNGRRLSVNEEFEADEEEGLDLIAIRRAHKAPVGIVDQIKRTYRRRDMKAEH